MVFEKIKKLFQREPEEREVRELTLEELEREVKRLKENTLKGARRDAGPILQEIRRTGENIITLAESLAKSESTEEVHPRLYKSAMEARRLLVDKAIRAAKAINPPSEPTWEELINFGKSFAHTGNLLNRATISHGRYVGILFRRETQQLMRLTSKLQSLSAQLNDLLNRERSLTQKFEDILEKIARCRELAKKTGKLRGREKALKNRIADLERVHAKELEELKGLMESGDFKTLEGLKQEREGLERELRGIENSIRLIISGLSRPLRKMKRLASTGGYPLGRDVIKTLDLYLGDPLEASISEEEGLPKLMELLRHLQKVMKEEKIKLDPREQRKTNKRIKEIVEHQSLAKLRAEYKRGKDRVTELEERRKSSPLLERKEKLERSISGHELELNSVKGDLKTVQDELIEIEKQTGEETSELERISRNTLGAELSIKT